MASLETVLQQVSRRIIPTEKERGKMAKLADQVKKEVEQILSSAGIQGVVTLQGSFARDTWVSGETDLDIFARFPHQMDRNEWIERVLPAIRRGLSRFNVIERYAEHPFLEFHIDAIRINVVPCYDVAKGDWKSATDRTPYHTEFMKKNLTPDLRVEARLLKKFAKGIGVYGAEIKIGGFSGMLIDTLSLYHRSFMETIRQASSWNPGTRLEIGKPPIVVDQRNREPETDLVVIDPVDPDRNLAAAVRRDRLWSFVAAARQFLQNPSMRFFFPTEFTKKTRGQFARRISGADRELFAVTFKHQVLVPDVLWGQLMKLERSLVEVLVREDFHVYRSKIWSDESKESAILLELDRSTLPNVRLQRGPPVSKREDSLSFLKRHLGARDTARGPWVEDDRWLVERKRKITTLPALVARSIREEARGLTVPKQIGESFPESARTLQGQTVLSLLGKPGLDKSLWEFLEARPSWLTPSPS